MTLVVCSTVILARVLRRAFSILIWKADRIREAKAIWGICHAVGKGFGASQGTSSVTVGGGAVASYQLWSDSKIIVQLGAGAVAGNIVVKVGSAASNGVHSQRGPATSFLFHQRNDANAGHLRAVADHSKGQEHDCPRRHCLYREWGCANHGRKLHRLSQYGQECVSKLRDRSSAQSADRLSQCHVTMWCKRAACTTAFARRTSAPMKITG